MNIGLVVTKEQNFVKDLGESSKLHAVGWVRELYGKERKVVICYDAKMAAAKKRERDEELKASGGGIKRIPC